MFETVQPLLDEHAELERRLGDPAVHADAGLARRLGRRYAELQQVVEAHTAWRAATDDAEAARELAAEDPGFAAELPGWSRRPRTRGSGCAASSCRATPTTPAT